MSQFILVANPVIENFPDYIQLKNVSNDHFFSEVAKRVFSDFESPKLFTIGASEKDFDQIFVDAQRDLIGGALFEDTFLYKLLLVILQNFFLRVGITNEIHDIKCLLIKRESLML